MLKMYLGAGNGQAREKNNGEGLHVAVFVADDAAQPNLRVKISGHTLSFYSQIYRHLVCFEYLFALYFEARNQQESLDK